MKRLKNPIGVIVGIVYWLLTFYLERFCFETSEITNNLFTYCLVKIMTLAVIVHLCCLVQTIIRDWRKKGAVVRILFYALVYIFVIGAVYVAVGAPKVSGDTLLLYNNAVSYQNAFGNQNYLTTYFYMISLNIVPNERFIVLFKIICSGLVVGYGIDNINQVFKTKLGIIAYGIFFLPPSLQCGYMIHRMHLYSMVYLLFVEILVFDYLKKKNLTKGKLAVLCVLIGVLWQWRIEGIYLLILGPVAIAFAYNLWSFSKKALIRWVAILLASCALLYVPQWLETKDNTDYYVADNLSHFYNNVLCAMMLYGLEDNLAEEEIEVIDRYVSIEKIKILNNDLGDKIFEDEYIRWLEGYEGIRPDTSDEVLYEYENTMKAIVLKNIPLFLNTQLRRFVYTTTCRASGGIVNLAQAVLTGNLILMSLVLFAYWIWSLIRKKWLYAVISTGLLGHEVITVVMMPSAYFKYFYAEYVVVGLAVVCTICILLQKMINKKRNIKEVKD